MRSDSRIRRPACTPATHPTRRAASSRLVKMLDLDDQELELLVTPVRTYLDDFGHVEAEILAG
jgi:hypothetical protein